VPAGVTHLPHSGERAVEGPRMRSRTNTDRRGTATRPTRSGAAAATRPRTLLAGVAGGVHATAVMTLYRLPIADSLPPTADFWATFVGEGRAEDYPTVGLALHVLYGAVAGLAFAPLFAAVARGSTAQRERRGVILGTAYGVVLSGLGRIVLLAGLLDQDLESDERWIFLVSHLVYGLTLGSWLGSSWSEG